MLFHDTLKYNIQYGDTSADEQKVLEASKMADLHDSVVKMPHGYNTVVGERGLKLSG